MTVRNTTTIVITTDNSKAKLGLTQTGAAVERLSARTRAAGRKMSESLVRVKDSIFSLKGAFAAIGAGVTAKSFLDVASSFEQMEKKLDALTSGRGKETLEEINAWALEMPVNTRKAVDTFAMMQAMGLDPTIEKMQTLVDVASVFGEDAMPRVARALGQMKTLGKLSAEELNQLSEAGINARKYLREAFGMGVSELQKSGIEIDRIIKAIMTGLDRDFGGAARANMDSWQGLKAATVSYIDEIERRIMDAGLFTELKTQLKLVNDELGDWLENNKDLIRQKVPEYLDELKDGISGIYQKFVSVKDFLGNLPGSGWEWGAAGYFLFKGPKGYGGIISAVLAIDAVLSELDLGLASIPRKSKELVEEVVNIYEGLSGRRDFNTGALTGNTVPDLLAGSDEWNRINHPLYSPHTTPAAPPALAPDSGPRQMRAPGKIGRAAADRGLAESIRAEARAAAEAADYYDGLDRALDRISRAAMPANARAAAELEEKYADLNAQVDELVLAGEKSQEWADRMHAALGDRLQEELDALAGKTKDTVSIIRDVSETAAGSVEQGFMNAFHHVGDGLDSLKSAANDVLQSIADVIWRQSVAQPAAAWVSNLINKFAGSQAAGGEVFAGRSYLVGENGPEMFVPAVSGSVVPNSRLSSPAPSVTLQQTISIDARGAAPGVEERIRAAVLEGARRGYEMVASDIRTRGPIRRMLQ